MQRFCQGKGDVQYNMYNEAGVNRGGRDGESLPARELRKANKH